ncbi:MAG: type II CAAX prenyl endopeptidase Rce1 family protein [Candidatus Thorarchaeota archaeon]
MVEVHYTTRFCPYCGTVIATPTKYCETCGVEITWSISETQQPPWPWTPKSTYSLTIITYGVYFLITIVLLLYYLVFWGIPLLDLIFITVDPGVLVLLTLTELVFVIIPIAFVKRLKLNLAKLGAATGGILTLAKDLLLGVAIGIAMVPLILVLDLYEILVPGTVPPPTPPTPIDLFWVGMLCVSVILVIAPTEEVLFRGFVQNSLDAHYGRVGGLLVASVIFGLAHLNPLIGIFQTIGGIILGLLFQWRGNRLAGPIAAHATFDCLIILLDAFLI